jgi:alcohol dehydrogenase (cytochrome c)
MIPRPTRRRKLTFAILALVAAGTMVAATFYGRALRAEDTDQDIWQKLSWRVKLYARKAAGGVPDLSWNELFQMTRQQGGFGLEGVTLWGLSLEGSLRNPYVTQEDLSAGARIFRQHCALCHGGEAAGGRGGPALNHSLKHGDSDVTIYKVLRDGIPDTPMAPVPLDFKERWQVVAYLRTLQLQKSESAHEPAALDIRVSAEQVLAAGSKTDEWLTYSGSLDGRRYSPLTELTPANVSQLQLRWVHQFDSSEPKNEATPLIVNGVIFTTEPPSSVVALDARSGNVIWRYSRSLPPDLPVCCGIVNRGLGVLGSAIFWASFDGYLFALNANTGKVMWQTQVANPSDGYTMTGAPLVVNRLVVVGVAGGEFGIRGFLAAYDADTGQQVWKFYTIPGPGEPGHETWENDAWQTGGGPTWITGSYDPSLDLIYWGVGNPAPDFSGDVRPGDNLFTNSVIALHASTGKLAWHFQFTPHDDHDWDSNQTPILADLSINGTRHQVICWANRNGFYYVLDRATGKFLAGVPFVEQNWTEGLDPAGRPRLVKSNSSTGQLIKPGSGTNWQNAAYDEKRGLIFIPANEGSTVFTKSTNPKRGDRGTYLGSEDIQQVSLPVVRALDAATGAKRWEHFSTGIQRFPSLYSGLLATEGELVFGAFGGYAFALDSATGHELWRVFLGGGTYAAPISFTLDGRQVIVVSAGHALFMFGLGEASSPTASPDEPTMRSLSHSSQPLRYGAKPGPLVNGSTLPEATPAD